MPVDRALPPPPRTASFPPSGKLAIGWLVGLIALIGGALLTAQRVARDEARDEVAPLRVEVRYILEDTSRTREDVRAIRNHMMGRADTSGD